MASNDAQQKAVNVDGHCLVLAIPGSGKTTLSIEKAVRLLRADKNNRVAMVVFNRSAALEVKERVLSKGIDY